MYLRVLIIEDETLVALHIKRVVMSLGHEVVRVVKSCEAALEIAQNQKIDLVFSDIKIIGENSGIECCRILHSTYQMYIVFITAYGDDDTLHKASQIDYFDYLLKPFQEKDLEHIIEKIAQQHTKQSNLQGHTIDGHYTYCYKESCLFLDDKVIPLSDKERRLLLALLELKGEVLFYDALEYKVWGGLKVSQTTRREFLHAFKAKLPDFPLYFIAGVGCQLRK